MLLCSCLVAGLFTMPVQAQGVGGEKTKNPFSMEFRDAELKDVLRAVGQAMNLNIIVSDTVTGKVTVSLKNVDLTEALESILKTKGLTYVREGNIVRILAASDARDADMDTRIFPLGSANSKEILSMVEKMKSDKARVSMDSQTNAIIVKDLSLNLDRMERLLKSIDTRAPQIMIEAKIVEVSSNYVRELGVQWGGRNVAGSGYGTTAISGAVTGPGAPAVPVGSAEFNPLTGNIGQSGNAFAVNLPAAVGQGAGGALGISFGKLGGKLSLDLQLSAMQTTGNGRILSSPKVMTQNNKEAKISSGVDIPVQTLQFVSSSATAGSTGVQIISASLMLSAIPTIFGEDRIGLALKVDKSEPDFTRQVLGIPTILKRNAETHVLVNNGETIVLGGILVKNETHSEAAVPLLSKIPLIGWLFKKDSKTDTQSELLIFITPTIVND